MLSRKEMEDIILNRKESVFIDGYGIIDDVANLPSEATLAKGDKEKEKAARASIKAQLKALQKDLATLDGAEDDSVEKSSVDESSEEASTEETLKVDDVKKPAPKRANEKKA